MMNDIFACQGAVVHHRYAVIAPSQVAPRLASGWEKATCHLVLSPAIGSRYVQLLVHLQADGQCSGNTGADQYFVSVLQGTASVQLDDRRHRLEAASYFYVPPGKDMLINSNGADTRLLVTQRRYRALAGVSMPPAFVNHERDLKPLPPSGAEGVQTRSMLPEQPSFDMAVNLVSFEPGAALPGICLKPVELARFMLRGRGLYRVEGDWHGVQAGDVVWTASYCPHQFFTSGRQGAAYLCFEEVNRDPV
jgi:(S)-ureidoglycine aminohydrolase